MTYTPTTWADDTPVTYTLLNNAETQYDEGYTYYLAHTHDTRYYTRGEMEVTYWYTGNDGEGSGCDGDLIYTSSGNLHYADIGVAGASIGLIILWSGAVGDIPTADGWHICNGSDGTIDLRDKWVVGAGSTYSVAATGGSTTLTATDTLNVASHEVSIAEMASHRHAWTDYYPPINDHFYQTDGTAYGWGSTPITHSGTTSSTGSGTGHTHTGSCTTTATENRPPSKAMCYIQKIT